MGGHCIPIDPNYLSHRVRTQLGYGFRFVELAQEINSSMPSYVVARVAELLNEQSQALRGSTVLLLGVTYKPDIADQRESPAIDVAQRLVRAGAVVRYHDPYVENWEVAGTERADADVLAAVAHADVSVLLQNHADYDLDAIEASARCLFDTRGRTTGTRAHRL